MNVVYASRTGNIEAIIKELNIKALRINDGNEVINEEYILFTYTDGAGNIPQKVQLFLNSNSDKLKGVIVSGDMRFSNTYCFAGDKISKQYDVPFLYKVEKKGTVDDINKIKTILDVI